MSYYDHATHLALRLDQWDLGGQNGTGDARIAREIHLGRMRSVTPQKRRSRWDILGIGRLFKRPSKVATN